MVKYTVRPLSGGLTTHLGRAPGRPKYLYPKHLQTIKILSCFLCLVLALSAESWYNTHMKIIVLSDGETWDIMEGCTLWELSAEGAEALRNGDLGDVSDEHILREEWIESERHMSPARCLDCIARQRAIYGEAIQGE